MAVSVIYSDFGELSASPTCRRRPSPLVAIFLRGGTQLLACPGQAGAGTSGRFTHAHFNRPGADAVSLLLSALAANHLRAPVEITVPTPPPPNSSHP